MFTKHSKIILTTLVAAAAMSVPAYADSETETTTTYTSTTTGVSINSASLQDSSGTSVSNPIALSDLTGTLVISGNNGGTISSSSTNGGYGGRVRFASGTDTSGLTKITFNNGIEAEVNNIQSASGLTFEFDNASFSGSTNAFAFDMVVGSGGVRLNGNSGTNYTYSGTISGTGDIYTCTGKNNQTGTVGTNFITGDTSSFSGGWKTLTAALLKNYTFGNGTSDAVDGVVGGSTFGESGKALNILTFNYTGDYSVSGDIYATTLAISGGNATFSGTSEDSETNASSSVNVSALTVAGGASATFSGTVALSSLTNSGTLTIDGGTLNLAGTLAASGSIAFSNGGSVALTGSLPDYTTSVSGYVDADGNASSDGNGYVGSGTLTVFNGGTLSGDSVSVSFENQNYTLNTSDGTISLSNIYSTYFVNSGTASVSSASHADTSSIVVAQDAKLLVENTTVGSKVVSGSGTVELNVSEASAQEFVTANVLTGDISVEKTGVNKATISAAQSYTGGTKISAGNLGVGNASALGTGAVELSGGQLTAQANLTLANALTIGENGGTIHTNTCDLTLSGAVSGTGTLTKAGEGKLVLSNNSLSLSNVSVSEGTLQVWNSTAAIGGSKTLSSVALASGTELSQYSGAIPTAATTVGALTLGGDATVSETHFGGSWKIEKLSLGADVDSATLTLNANHSAYNFALFELGNSTVSDSGNFSGTIALTQTSTGTARGTGVILSNENIAKNAVVSVTSSPTGASTTAENNPVLLVGINASNVNIAGLQGGTAYTYLFSGTVASGTTQTVTSNSTTGTTAFQSHWVTDGDAARTLTIDTAASMSYDYAGTILANVNLVKDGAGTQTLSGASTAFDGTVEVKAGVLALGNASAIGTDTSVTIDGGRLQVASGVTLNATAITIALSDAYSSDAAIFGGDTTSTLAAGTTFTLTADEDVLSAIASYTSVSYQILDTNTIVLAGALSADDFTLSSALSNAGWTVSDYSNGLVTLSIPEPSAFGLLAGVGALALVASRRRRRAK